MINRILITNPAGDTLTLDLRTSLDDHGLLIFNLTGLGSPKATVSGLSGPTYDGITGEFVRTDARQLLLTIAIPVRGDAEEVAKQKVYDFFPVKEEITFRITTDAKDAYVMAIVESVEMNQFSKVENAIISLYCPDPYFLDMVGEWAYGEYGGTSKTITYEGEVPTGALITVTCGDPWSWGGSEESMGTCVIENDRDNQSMTIQFVSFAEGDRYLITSSVGQKRVVHIDGLTEVETDVTSFVIPTSDWIKLYPGDNVLSVTIGGTYQGPLADRPADPEVFLPFNEYGDHTDGLEMANGYAFTKEDADILGNSPGILYPIARQWDRQSGLRGYIKGPSDIALCPTGDHTFTFWVYIDDWSVSHVWLDILGGGQSPNSNGIQIRSTTSENVQYRIKAGTFSTATWPSVPLSTWMCFFCWYDESANTMYIQRDAGTPVSVGSVTTPSAYTAPWLIGTDEFAIFATGRLQGMVLYDAVLSAAERTWVYNSGTGRTYAELSAEHELDVLYRPRYQGV